jgi:P27 family predicted phage terminase small subunit
MARGRKPSFENVVPMAEEGQALRNLTERAKLRREELRPEGLPSDLRWVFDELALPLCRPDVNRLKETNIRAFVILCREYQRYEMHSLEISELGATYDTGKGRNGNQIRPRPENAMLDAAFKRMFQLMKEFGMTPASERGVTGEGQLPFDFPEPGEPESYMT